MVQDCHAMHFVFTAPRFHTNQHFPAKALLVAGHRVTFVVLRRGRSETYEAVEPVIVGCSPVFDILRRAAAKLPWVGYSDVGGMPSPLRFFATLRQLQPATVVVREPKSAYGMLATLSAKLLGAKLIFYTQTARHQRMSRLKRLRFPVMLAATGAHWFTPLLGTPTLHPPVHRDLRYVPFVVEPATAPGKKQWCRNGVASVLAIGKFQPRKNHALFLEAIASVMRHHDVRAVIVGECTTDEHRQVLAALMQQRCDLGLQTKVEIRTNLLFAEVQELYATHDLFVLASRGEPAAVSPLEAMAHSLPVICSDTNGTACYVSSGRNGFVFRTDDVADLAKCLRQIVGDRERLIEMGRESYRLALAEHKPSRYVDALVDMATRS